MTGLSHGVRSALQRTLLVPVLVFAGLGLVGGVTSCTSSDDPDRAATGTTAVAPGPSASVTTTRRTGVTHDFVVPAGTAAIVARGGDPGIIPDQLDVRVGDRIRVRNDDTEIARLGIFDVGPGETMTMTFNEVNVLTGVKFAQDAGGCGSPVPEKKKFIINVRP